MMCVSSKETASGERGRSKWANRKKKRKKNKIVGGEDGVKKPGTTKHKEPTTFRRMPS